MDLLSGCIVHVNNQCLRDGAGCCGYLRTLECIRTGGDPVIDTVWRSGDYHAFYICDGIDRKKGFLKRPSFAGGCV